MNSEENRLKTFRHWPSNAPVDASRIAKAGFYYSGHSLEVQCFSCGGRISDWNYNDKVMTRHRMLDPSCPFVVSPSLSGNIPMTSNAFLLNTNNEESTSSTRSSETLNTNNANAVSTSHDEMCDEQSRLDTFTNWPISFIVTPENLAKAGFYYVQQGDKVRCPFCSVLIGRWEAGDDPLSEHRRHSPACSYVQRQFAQHSNISMPDHLPGLKFRQGIGDITLKSLGVQNHRVAKHPKYVSKESRIATYTSWPPDVVQTPNDLAEAGFYYAGSDDQVRCFHCDGGLRKWDPSDDPWVEHARWFPECGFMMLVRGEEFINEAIHNYPPIIPQVSDENSSSIDGRPVQVTDNDLEALMSGPIVTAVLQTGLDLSRVKMAIRQKFQETGATFTSADDLIEATLDIQLDEVFHQDPEDNWCTPLHSPLHSGNTRAKRVLYNHRISPRNSSDSSDSESESACPKQTKSKSVLDLEKTEEPVAVESETERAAPVCERKVTLEEENRRLREARLCKICMDNEVCIVFLPCGHLVTCVNCAHSLADCPVCRQNIKATVRTFLS